MADDPRRRRQRTFAARLRRPEAAPAGKAGAARTGAARAEAARAAPGRDPARDGAAAARGTAPRTLGLPYAAGPALALGAAPAAAPRARGLDPWEREAHEAAARVAAGGAAPTLSPLPDAAGSAASDRRGAGLDAVRRPGRGRPLEGETRRRLEGAFGRPLGHLRVHDGAGEGQVAERLGARAFAHRHHIWLAPRESAGDLALLAHEVAHVVQQGQAPADGAAGAAPGGTRSLAAAAGAGGLGASEVGPDPAGAPGFGTQGGDRAEAGATGAGPAGWAAGAGPHRARTAPGWARARAAAGGGRAAAAGAGGRAAAAGAVQRWLDVDFDPWGAARSAGAAVASGVSSAAGAVVEFAGDLMTAGRDAVLDFVRQVAPDFLRLFESGGIRRFLREAVGEGIRSLFDGLAGPFRSALDFGAGLGAGFQQAVAWFAGVVGQLARNDCSAVLAAASRAGQFLSGVFGPVIDRVRGTARSVAGFFSGIWNAVGAPVMDFLRRIGGSLWQSVRGFISDVGEVIGTVRDALGSAWTRVKGWFGVEAESGTGEGGGLWNWIKEKAGAVWDGVMETLQPVMGPLRAVGGVLLAISPAGPILAVIRAWPHLRRAFAWVQQAWSDLNLVVRARRFWTGTVVPALMSGAETVGQALVAGADWLLGLLGRVAQGVASASGALSGGLLAPLGRLIRFAQSKFQLLVDWARGGLKAASANMRSMLRRLMEFFQVVLQALLRLLIMATNPLAIIGFLAGTLWRLVPDCLKGPIIDFILTILLRVLRALPPMPLLGPLWPFVKAAMIGFLQRVLGFAMERKVAVSKKVAKIVSGGSVEFMVGYVRGLVIGIWEAIVGPFRAIADLFELPALVRSFLERLNISREQLMEAAEGAMGTLDSILEAARDLLANPDRVLEMLRGALEAALSAATELGATLAGSMMEIFEQAEDRIGEMLGTLAGNALVTAVLTYFTAGGAAAAGAISRVVALLGRAVRHIVSVVRQVLRWIPRILRHVRRLAGRFTAAGSRSGGLLGRIVRFLQRLMRRLRRMMRRRRGGGRKWRRFERQARGLLRRNRRRGIAEGALRGALGRLRVRFATVVASVSVRRKGRTGFLRVRARRRRRPSGFRGEVPMDQPTRWRLGRQAVDRALRRLKRLRQLGLVEANRALRRIRRDFGYRRLTAGFDRGENEFVVRGGMSPSGEVDREDPPKPSRNRWRSLGIGAAEVDPLVRSSGYNAPIAWPTATSAVRHIRTVRGRTSLYIRGHLVSGHLSGPGSPANLTPLTRRANALMLTLAEREAKRRARSARAQNKVYSYRVTTHSPSGGMPPPRWLRIPPAAHWVQASVPQERMLARAVSMTLREKRYEPTSKRWLDDRIVTSVSVLNVPEYPAGYVPSGGGPGGTPGGNPGGGGTSGP